MISKSPFGEVIEYNIDYGFEKKAINYFVGNKRKNVVVQGLGFVGAAMVAALSQAKDENGNCLYNVIGIDLPDEKNFWKIRRTNNYKPPVVSTDNKLKEAYRNAAYNRNVMATYTEYAYSVADIVVVDINLDIKKQALGQVQNYKFSYNWFKKDLRSIAENIKEETLIIVETTVPPGTTEKIINPLFKNVFEKRGLNSRKFFLVHSYERVMPGSKYYDSIVNFYRVFSGIDNESKERGREFLESFINTRDYPLKELHSTTASEMSKVLENSYRAANIAFIKEWTKFAESANVNLFEIIDAIRVRPTHNNIMFPGFGVGGYCLPKDALMADWAYRNNFNNNDHLTISINAISINDLMPEYTYKLLKKYIKDLNSKKLAILGISYLNDVSDTRSTPTEYFYDLCKEEGATIELHDPLVSYWQEKDIEITTSLRDINRKNIEVVVFTVKHKEYTRLTDKELKTLFPDIKMVIDANNVISDNVAKDLTTNKIKVVGVGKGHWNEY